MLVHSHSIFVVVVIIDVALAVVLVIIMLALVCENPCHESGIIECLLACLLAKKCCYCLEVEVDSRSHQVAMTTRSAKDCKWLTRAIE
eukprot:2512645-Amphidinium_carterae.1